MRSLRKDSKAVSRRSQKKNWKKNTLPVAKETKLHPEDMKLNKRLESQQKIAENPDSDEIPESQKNHHQREESKRAQKLSN